MPGRSAADPFAAGSAFGADIMLLEHLRRGNDLDVYDAWSHERGASVVVKMVRPDRRHLPRTITRLMTEGELLLGLTHPHIVRCYEIRSSPLPALVLETLGGRTLSALLDDEDLSVPEVGHLGLHLAAAVRYLHSRGILHLDLKPSNVIEDGGRAKLLDLSIARPPGKAPPGVGTWCYQAPEQVTGGVLGPAADVWGLGVTLYEAASGVQAFDGPPSEDDTGSAADDSWPASDDTGATTSADESSATATDDRDDPPAPQLEGPPPPLQELRDLSRPLVRLIDRCLDPEPSRRPTVEEVLARLEPIAGVPPIERRFA